MRIQTSGDFRGRVFSAPADFRDVHFTVDADFSGARFEAQADFSGAVFSGAASFDDVTFRQDASYGGARFEGGDGRFVRAHFARSARFERSHFAFAAEFDKATVRGDASFEGAVFTSRAGVARFDWATFAGSTRFSGAQFLGTSVFDRVDFGRQHASFAGARFSGDAYFVNARLGPVDFDHAQFEGATFFVGARFGARASFASAHLGETDFHGARFGDDVALVAASFDGMLHFDAAVVHGDLASDEARFAKGVDLSDTEIVGTLSLTRARFAVATALGPAIIARKVELDGARFDEHVTIRVSTRRLVLDEAELRGGLELYARWASVSMEDVDFAQPSLVTALRAKDGWKRREARRGLDSTDESAAVPRLVSIRRSTVARLTCLGIDLRPCRFAGSRSLDELHLIRAQFSQPPDDLRWYRRGVVRWTRRQTIAEEHQWRQQQWKEKTGHDGGWATDAVQAPKWLSDQQTPLAPEQLAGIYRMLRKGREDRKDAPGAADFYYGEMEMRREDARHCPDAARLVPRAERWLLGAYWLVSGYGLRSSRALVALVVAILLLAIPLDAAGFRPDRTYGGAVLYAAESSVSLFGFASAQRTDAGLVVSLVLRVTGPLLVGLALLSVRGRVKR